MDGQEDVKCGGLAAAFHIPIPFILYIPVNFH